MIRISIHDSLDELWPSSMCSPSAGFPTGAVPYWLVGGVCPGKSNSGRAKAPPIAKSAAGYAACVWNKCNRSASMVSNQALASSTLISGILRLRNSSTCGCMKMTPTISFTPNSFKNDALGVQIVDNNQVFWLSTDLANPFESDAPLSCSRLATMNTAMVPERPSASGNNSGSGIPT